MRKKIQLLCAAALATTLSANAQLDPSVTSWVINLTGATGYNSIPSNVQQVQYSTGYVYVSATCIPGYSIGPWAGNPNVASNQNFVYKITRTPQQNTGTPTAVGLGHVGVFTNGVSVFNTQDANSYNNLGIWNQNAYFFEGSGFDNCLGHPQQQGEYHHHVSPKCLYNITDSTHHSPIIGFAFDGFPIYGAYAYTNTDGTGAIKRMKSSYQLRNITDRTTLPNGTTLPANEYGPAIGGQYPLGAYQEDYVYTAGSGDLDDHNGRFCKTPEYPNGIYCYFVTIDASLNPQYPYTLGLTYYGVITPGNIGPGGGHNTITEPVNPYPANNAVQQVTNKDFSAMVFPNPASEVVHLFIQPIATSNFTVTLFDETGRAVYYQSNIQPTIMYDFDVTKYPAGMYTLTVKNDIITYNEKVVIKR